MLLFMRVNNHPFFVGNSSSYFAKIDSRENWRKRFERERERLHGLWEERVDLSALDFLKVGSVMPPEGGGKREKKRLH